MSVKGLSCSYTVLTVAESLLRKCEVSFSGSVMRVVNPSPSDAAKPVSDHRLLPDRTPISVRLSGIPDNTSQEVLVMYLENKRKSGGGPVRSVDYDDKAGTADVCFEDDTSKITCDVLLTLVD